MLQLTPEQQRDFIAEAPEVFEPCNGAWGERGATRVHLPTARPAWVQAGLLLAQANVLACPGASLRRLTPLDEIHAARERRQGGGEWQLELDGTAVGKGGLLFHYNPPYGDVWMDVAEPHRRRGLGAWLVQELKRECHELGAVLAARCSPDNLASRQTLQKAGFVPRGHVLIGSLG
jgi:RimJ/RimL family protein N-acetyltransferase